MAARSKILAGAAVAGGALAWTLSFASPYVMFLIAVASAVGWSVWLDASER